MTRRDLAVVVGVLLTIVAYAGLVEAFAFLAWFVLAGAVLYVVIGSIVVLIVEPRTSRSGVMDPVTPARLRGPHPRSGGLGHVATRRRTRAAGVSARQRPPTSRKDIWIGDR